MARPNTPTSVKVNGKDEQDGLVTKSTGTITIKATVSDSDNGQKVRLVVLLSPNKKFTPYATYKSAYASEPEALSVKMVGLAQNTLYYARLYAQDKTGNLSKNYNSTNFWTNRRPSGPELITPAENSAFLNTSDVVYDWQFVDPDDNTTQAAYELRWRKAALPGGTAGSWVVVGATTQATTYTAAGGTYNANNTYEWQVRGRDPQKAWGEWSAVQSFFVYGTTTPPTLLEPVGNIAVTANEANTFKWTFLSPDGAELQLKANFRYRAVGAESWITYLGTIDEPGMANQWTIGSDTFIPGVQYEWSVQTYDSASDLSDWADPATFWAIVAPGSLDDEPVIGDEFTVPASPLGCGHHRVFIYDRGGQVPRGEITPIAHMQWGRKRDDISNALVTVNGWGDDCGELLATLRSWIHEIVIFRDGVRVWEGPVTRVSYKVDQVEIEAKDVMAYVYRRILRQGYNDSYHLVDGVQLGLRTVVDRAGLITLNCLAYDDPNVIGYMSLIAHDDDARQSRVVADYSRTAWEEIDDLAATAGLDYTTVGRRIIYWDTHRQIGLLPEMRDGDFSDPPVVTEYGMNAANHFGVTNANGVYGVAERLDSDGQPLYYGWLEQLASAYGETVGATPDTLTASARAELEVTLAAQAERNISGRYPVPLVVRIPDNSTLNPELNVGINQLIPGVHIPLRAVGTLRTVTQIQKLDSITVTEDSNGEKIAVVMSPAPNINSDDDAASIVAEG